MKMRASLAALLIALTVYFAIGLTQLRLPGLQYDEAADAVPALQALLGQPSSAISTVTLFGKAWPLMLLHHIGPSSIYTSLLGMSLFGITVEGLRISQLCVGALTLILLWGMGRAWFDNRTASMAVLLCATAPAFIWWNRAGANWTAPLLPLALGFIMVLRRTAHALDLRGLATKQAYGRVSHQDPGGLVFLAGLLFGLGFTTKILFVWLLAPVALTALIALKPYGVLARIRSVAWPSWLAGLMGLALGLAPFILHNLRPASFLATFKFVVGNASQTRLYGHNNLDFFNNLALVIGEFFRMMGGDTLAFRAPAGLPLGAVALIAALLYTAWRLVRHRANTPHANLRLFLWLSIVAVLPLSTISTSSIGATYLFILVPFAWLLIATVLSDLFSSRSSWIPGFSRLQTQPEVSEPAQVTNRLRPGVLSSQFIMACALVTLLCLNHLATNAFIHRFFAQTGGQALWSDAIYDLSHTLQAQHPTRSIIAMDWGLARNLQFLSQGQLNPREAFDYAQQPPPTYEDLCISLLREPHNLYLFHNEDQASFRGRWRLFERAALKTRKQLVLLHAFTERSGITHTLVYEAQEAAPQFAMPQLAQPRNAKFDEAITLLSGTASYDPTHREIAITLHWQAHTTPLPNDTVLLHLVDPITGQTMLTGDQQPVYGNYPFSQWQNGEVVADAHWLSLPENIKPGIYQVRVGLYDTQTGNRRTILDPQNDAAGNSLLLQLVEIP